MTCHHRAPFRMLILSLCIAAMSATTQAAQVDSNGTYCFLGSDFSGESGEITGVCITGLPDAELGAVKLSDRLIRAGDILTIDQLRQMTFSPFPTETDTSAQVQYLPIFPDHVAPEAVMTISIHGKEDKAPIAEDSSIETYKNLPNGAPLKVSDPEQQTLTYTVIRQPKRGTVEIKEDGSFLYTPKHNKVGTDSFTYTATDPAGNVSREATITIKILKPTDSQQYTDTMGSDCRFAAEWMRNTGIFSGETVNGQACFRPEEPVSRGQFLSMLMEVLDLPVENNAANTGFIDDAPTWLKPYLSAALRSGIIAGYPTADGVEFRPDQAITGSEASDMVQNALNFAIPTVFDSDGIAATWAREAAAAVIHGDVHIAADDAVLTRANTAQLLYRLSNLKENNPGISMFFTW